MYFTALAKANSVILVLWDLKSLTCSFISPVTFAFKFMMIRNTIATQGGQRVGGLEGLGDRLAVTTFCPQSTLF